MIKHPLVIENQPSKPKNNGKKHTHTKGDTVCKQWKQSVQSNWIKITMKSSRFHGNWAWNERTFDVKYNYSKQIRLHNMQSRMRIEINLLNLNQQKMSMRIKVYQRNVDEMGARWCGKATKTRSRTRLAIHWARKESANIELDFWFYLLGQRSRANDGILCGITMLTALILSRLSLQPCQIGDANKLPDLI